VTEPGLEGAAFRRYEDGTDPMRLARLSAAALRAPLTLALALAMAAVLAACAVPVAGGLDDSEANRIFVALDRASVDAVKEQDPTGDGRWRVTVARDDLPRALSVMREEDLPRRDPLGVIDAVGKGSLVPSEAAEHAQLVAAISGELERSLEGIDGVLKARVHLNVPEASPLRDAPPTRGSAGVLIEHRGATPPVSAESIQRLVAGGVAGLAPADVVVVMVARPAPVGLDSADGLAHVGPIAVTRASMRQLQAALIALVALVAALAGATLALYSRLARARSALAGELPSTPGAP
jgi:type III secretion protein J